MDTWEAQQHAVGTNGPVQWSTPWHLMLATGWTKTFCGESPAFLSLPLRHHFYPQARPLTTKLLPTAQLIHIGRGMAMHTRVTLEEPMGRQASAWWSGASRAWLESWVSQPACSVLFPIAKT